MAVEYLGSGNDDGVVLGRTAADLVGFHNATPIAQMTVTTAPASTGASNSSPYGFTGAAQADAIVTWIRAVDAHLKLKGIIASS